ncbi:MAG: hypothetical protein ACLQPD_19650 [Desulfomonilaceae bacterium]
MLTKEGLEFLLRITDYFHGHWEDPHWGQTPINQVSLMLSAPTLVNGVAETEVRRQIQGPFEKAMADVAQKVVKISG